jgi:hypothetical protein
MTMREIPNIEKYYIGDGAYVEWRGPGWDITLTTSDGLRDTNTIVLGPSEWDELVRRIDAVTAASLKVKIAQS